MANEPIVSDTDWDSFVTVGEETLAVEEGALRIHAYAGFAPTASSGFLLKAGQTWTFGPGVTVHHKADLGARAVSVRVQSRLPA